MTSREEALIRPALPEERDPMATDRITAWAIQQNGTRSFGVVVRGVKVLVTADEDHHDTGRALAEAIAALGPEAPPALPPEPPAPVATHKESRPTTKRTFVVGQRVRCTVHGAEGEHTVMAVGTDHHRGMIKISGFRPWCPTHNFVPVEA